MGTLWTMIVPIIVMFVMMKMFKALGLGNIMNPMTAMSLATGGAGKLMGDKDSVGLAKGMGKAANRGAVGVRKAPGAALNKAEKVAKWAKGNSMSRKLAGMAGRGVKATAKAGAGAGRALDSNVFGLVRKDKRAALAARMRTMRHERSERRRDRPSRQEQRTARREKLRASWQAGKERGGRLGGVRGVLGAAWDEHATDRGQDVAAGRHMLRMLASAGVVIAGETRPNLAEAMSTWSKKLSPDSPEALTATYRRQLTAETSYAFNEDDIGRAIASWSQHRQTMLATAVLGVDLAPGSILAPTDISALRGGYAEHLGVPADLVMVDATTGVTMLTPSGPRGIPVTRNAATLMAYADSPLTWMPESVTARRPGESVDQHAFRMRETLVHTGYLDPSTNAMVSMTERLGLGDGADLTRELAKLAAGRDTDLSKLLGSVTISEQALRDIDIAVAHNFPDLDTPLTREVTMQVVERQYDQAQADVVATFESAGEAAYNFEHLHSALAAATGPLEMRVVLDTSLNAIQKSLRDTLEGAAEQMADLYAITATVKAAPTDYVAVSVEADAFHKELKETTRNLIDDLQAQLNSVRDRPVGADTALYVGDIQNSIDHSLKQHLAQLTDSFSDVARTLAEVRTANSQASAHEGNGVPRPGDYANAPAPPPISIAS